MKQCFFLLAFALITFSACRKSTDEPTVSDGEVIGFRAEKCLCCPGNLIKIGNDTLQFEQFPPNTPKFVKPYPYRVNLDWQRDTSFCGRQNSNRIIVTRIQIL